MNYKNIAIIFSIIFLTEKVFSVPSAIKLDEEECLTKECYETSKKILSGMDTSVNPCEDFYQFTCGNWNNNEMSYRSNWEYVQQIINNKLEDDRVELLTSDYKANENLPKEEQEYEEQLFNKMKDIFNVCLNSVQSNGYEKEYIINFINKLNIYESMEGLNDTDKLTHLIDKLENNGFEMFFNYPYQRYMDYNSNILFHSNYGEKLKNFPELIPIFKQYIKNILKITHSDENVIDEKAELIFDFGQKLSNIEDDDDDNDIIDIDINTISEKCPFINWKLYYKKKFDYYGIERNIDTVVFNMRHLKFFEEMSNVIRETDYKTLTVYIEWMVTKILASTASPEEFDDANIELNMAYENLGYQYNDNDDPTDYYYNYDPNDYDYYNYDYEPTDNYYGYEPTNYDYGYEPTDYVFDHEPTNYEYGYEPEDHDYEPTDYNYNDNYYNDSGNDNNEDYSNNYYDDTNYQQIRLYSACAGIVYNIMPLSITKFFLDKNLSKETRNETKKMLENIKESMINKISNMEWLDKETKGSAKEKVMKMKEIIGYPDEIMNVKYLYQKYKDIEVEDFLTLTLYNNIGMDRDVFDPFGQNQMIMDTNAFYIPESNTINMNAAILNPPFISINIPDYLNYGAIAEILGHELTHAFDSVGKYYDSNGEKNNWWTDDDDENYNELTQCFIDEYNNFSFNGKYLDGIFTLQENIADNGGIARAYEAWQLSLKNNLEEVSNRNKKLPGLSNYTLDQLFYISYGHLYCTADNTIIEFNNHSPSKARVNVVLSNSKHFAKTFNCPKNSPMNPENKCELW